MVKKNQKSSLLLYSLLLFFFVLSLPACNSSDDPVTTDNTGTVTGTVADAAGTPLSGVALSAVDLNAASSSVASAAQAISSAVTTTDATGQFSLSMNETSRALLTFTLNGHVLTAQITPILKGQTVTLEAVMAAEGATSTLDATVGGTVTHNNGSVVIAPNTLVDADGIDFIGQADVAVTTFDPTTESDFKAFPGEFEGLDENQQTVPFMSYGFMDITPTDQNGDALQLKEGSTAAIIIPIPLSLRSGFTSPPATMPLWYFDPDLGLWIQEGTLTLNNAWDAYEGTVGHFSIWNADHPYDRAFVSGRVVDGSGNPIAGAVVVVRGVTPRNNWSVRVTTATDGTFPSTGTLPVEADSRIDIWATKGGISSTAVRFTSGGASSSQVLVDIILDAATSSTSPYMSTTLLASNGFDFSENLMVTSSDTNSDGYPTFWDPTTLNRTGAWWVPTNAGGSTDSFFADMGPVTMESVTEIPAAWDAWATIPSLTKGNVYVAKCVDGHVKFKVIELIVPDNPHGELILDIQYYWSATTTFAD
ncbi:MAG: hypothetical protein KKE17_05755 [Proteobacteria bacterium]|nr:hypothetical protein [Pseudomonadota bacterium]MBU1709492.1 hypothetical protein [Pseudomonadota bacterium]